MPMNGQAQNRLLARLHDADYARLVGHLERVSMPHGAVLSEPGDDLQYAYFPVGCVLSSIIVLNNGSSVEAATTGNEGMIDVGLVINGNTTPCRIIQQVAGDCLRIRAETLHDALEDIPRLRKLLHKYCLALLHQSFQNSACNLQHSVEERMARWLLVCADRSNKSDLDLTQEFLSAMLGVRRQSVNVTAGQLQRAGLIAYRRGGVKIIDRQGLTAAACECYRVTTGMYERNMSM
jgi:CRP-like cAMP-binding protein